LDRLAFAPLQRLLALRIYHPAEMPVGAIALVQILDGLASYCGEVVQTSVNRDLERRLLGLFDHRDL
jgi:hypothetical protein